MIELVCAVIYAIYLWSLRYKPHRIILYYHDVKKRDVGYFRKQMRYLVKKKYKVVKVSEIKGALPEGSRALVGLTFDDALLSVKENAIPVLAELGLQASVFVPTGYLGRRPEWPMDRNCLDENDVVMNEQQIAAIARDGFEIFSHSVSHCVLTNLEGDRLSEEMVQSKQTLERIVGHKIPGVSYPYGAHNKKVCESARQAGYQYGFTIEPHPVEPTTDNLQIGRFSVRPSDGLLKFMLKVMGAYQVSKYLRAIKAFLNNCLPGIGKNKKCLCDCN